jgi:UPF0288 family protein (methanogenesis marker protein 3)
MSTTQENAILTIIENADLKNAENTTSNEPKPAQQAEKIIVKPFYTYNVSKDSKIQFLAYPKKQIEKIAYKDPLLMTVHYIDNQNKARVKPVFCYKLQTVFDDANCTKVNHDMIYAPKLVEYFIIPSDRVIDFDMLAPMMKDSKIEYTSISEVKFVALKCLNAENRNLYNKIFDRKAVKDSL